MADQKFEATPTLENGQVTWSLCYYKGSNKDCAAPGSLPPVALQHSFFPKTYHFTFTIYDQTGLGIVFAPKPPPATNDGPLWIQANAKPTGLTIDSHITAVNVAGATKLSFNDKNGGAPVNLHYQLNFVNSKGQKVTAIDPEIKNGGSTINLAFLSAPILVIGAAVLLALVFTAYRAFAKHNLARAPSEQQERR